MASPTPTVFLLAIIVSCWLVSCQRDQGASRRAILILLDTARADHFTTNGYQRNTTPEIAALARRGVVFLRHYSADTHTRSALPPLLYSRHFAQPLFPHSKSIPFAAPEELFQTPDDGAISLPQALSQNGFKTAMISAHSWTVPESSMARQFGEVHHLPNILRFDGRYKTPRAKQVVDYAIEWLGEHRNDDVFLYLHLMDTHFPHFLEEEALEFLPPGGLPEVDGSRLEGRSYPDTTLDYTESDRRYLTALYDGSLRFADRHLGRLFAYLRNEGLLETTLIVLTSDHGEHLLEQPDRWTHGGPWYDAVAHVPMIVVQPGHLPPARTEMLSQSVDVMPTILGLLGLRLPEGKRADGIDLSLSLRGEIEAPNMAFSAHSALRGQRYKVIFASSHEVLLGEPAPDPTELSGELYDLHEDPGESIDLWSVRPDIVARMLAAYRQHLQGPFRRFKESTTTRQPDSPFAIGAKFLEAGREVPIVENPLPSSQLAQQPWNSDGWVRSLHWQNYQFFAAPWAAPLELRARIPNGTYSIAIGLSGAARTYLADGESPVEVHSGLEARYDPTHKPSTQEFQLGEAQVTNQTFSLTVEPLEPSQLLLRYIGFTPQREGRETPVEDTDRLEQLRALGYLD